MSKQSTSHLFMFEPESFYSNEQTAFTNHYQEQVTNETPEIIAEKALLEFHGLKNAIEDKGIKVTCLKGSKDCPDHIFPNWFITFDDKTMQIFSMMAPNRRKEKKPSMIEHLTNSYELTDDMSYLEDKEVFLESTSSMVFDRVNRIVYLTISPRANAGLANEWCNENNYELVMFETESHTGSPIYHTDVLMYVGTTAIGICYEVIKPEYRDLVKKRVERFHDVIEIKKEQLLNFCGNCLEIPDKDGNLLLALSTSAFNAYTELQKEKIEKHFKKIVHTDISTIEKYGGGSARCMLAELF